MGADGPQGPEWWQASDGKWYPPQPQVAAPPPPPPPPPYGQHPQGLPPQQPQYAQPQYAQPQFPPPQPAVPSKSGNGCLKAFLVVLGILVVLAVIAVVAVGLLVNKVSDTVEKGSREMKPNEVAVSTATCQLNASNTGEASGTLTNNTGEAQGFEVRVDFNVNGTRTEQATTFIPTLGAGDTTNWTVFGVQGQTASPTCSTKVYATLFDNLVPTDSLPIVPTT